MRKAKILKERKTKISEEEKENIIEELLSTRKVKVGQLINYEQFLELYEPYEETLNEQDFAEILGISYSNYNNIKHNGTSKAKILKERKTKISEEEREKIIEELLSIRKVKVGQSIDYSEFLELYEPYKEKLNEQDFAEILGISYSSHYNIKHNGTSKAKILKERKTKISEEKREEISEEKREEIIEELLMAKKVRVGQLINYEQFLELYELYKEVMYEQDFAGILGISYVSYMNVKNKRNKSKNIKRNTSKDIRNKL